MAPLRVTLALVVSALLVTVSLVLLSPPSASAQATHSGTFSLDAVTATQLAVYKGSGTPESVLVTVCVASGSNVDVLADGVPVFTVSSNGCRTRKLMLNKFLISIGGSGTSTGTYSFSINLP